MKLTSADTLRASVEPGLVYRRAELVRFSKDLDRDLQTLEKRGELRKLARGLYHFPKLSRFGTLPPNEKQLVQTFLGSTNFLLIPPNSYNDLGLGLTQLYNTVVVYNRKRHLKTQLGSKTFDFRRPPEFPSRLSKEFMLVDLLNNLDSFAEETEKVPRNVQNKLNEYDCRKLLKYAFKYGKLRTKRFLQKLIEDNKNVTSQSSRR